MKHLLMVCLILLTGFRLPAQGGLDLETCYRLAEERLPVQKLYPLQEQKANLEMDKLALQRLPQVSWNAKVVGQSQGVEVPFTPPGADGPIRQPLINGQTTLEASYLLYDGGVNEAQGRLVRAEEAVDRQSVAVEANKLKPRINSLFFNILLLQAQDSILENNQGTLQARLEVLKAGEKQGTVLPGVVTQLEIEILKLQSRREETAGKRKAMAALLADMTGLSPEQTAVLKVPDMQPAPDAMQVNRPELKYFDLRRQQIAESNALIDAGKKPMLSLFAQAGVGYANPLNFFDQSLSPFAIGGVQFRWAFDWGKSKKDKELTAVKMQTVENQREQFLYELNLLDNRYAADKATIEKQIERDREIASLQTELLNISASQLNHGVITASEYLQQFNAGVDTQLNVRLHELALLQLQADYFTQKGF